MHFIMTGLIGANVLTLIAVSLFFISGKIKALSFLSNGVSWIIIFSVVYLFVYFYFLSKKKYLSITKNFYKTSKCKGKKGTILAIAYTLASVVLLLAMVFYLAKDKFA